jgi:hypothetical protein
MKTYWGSEGITPRILDLGTRWRWLVSFTQQRESLCFLCSFPYQLSSPIRSCLVSLNTALVRRLCTYAHTHSTCYYKGGLLNYTEREKVERSQGIQIRHVFQNFIILHSPWSDKPRHKSASYKIHKRVCLKCHIIFACQIIMIHQMKIIPVVVTLFRY